jgi:ABC-type multidrug transport system ATPase subunit
LSLAASIVYNPDIIVFDEPTTGLDPLGRKLIKSVIKQLKSEGHSIIFSTHMLADLPDLCDRMAIIHQGKTVFVGTVSEFCKDSSLTALEECFAKYVSSNGDIKC